MTNEYELLDSGNGRKLERFGDVVLSRPCAQAAWDQQRPELWSACTASYDRDRGWTEQGESVLPSSWITWVSGIALLLAPTDSGQLGVFPETRELWGWITGALRAVPQASVLNLFAYSGGATLAAARAGSSACHVDSARSMVNRASENAALNDLGEAPIRWIVDDVSKFLGREIRRERGYDAIILDPPSFGHGAKGERYKIDKDLTVTLEQCKVLLSKTPVFVLLTAHTQGMTAEQLADLLGDLLDSGTIEHGPMELTGASDVRRVPSGVWARWVPA